MYKVSFKINGEDYVEDFSSIEDIVNDFVTEDYIDSCIDEVCDSIEMFGFEYLASVVLKSVDSVAYRAVYEEYIKAIIDDLKYEIIEGEMKTPIVFLDTYTITPIV